MTEASSTRAIIAAFLANLGIAVLKFIGFLITGAASMLAESIHSVADTGNQGLLILGGRRGRQGPDEEHPFGYGRERYFWAFLVAVVLFTVGSVYALYEGIEKLRHPHELTNPPVAIAILLGAIVLESWSLRTAVREASHIRGDRSWWSFIRHTKNPELPVVLLEDLGALIGLVFALVGISLAVITDNPRFDALGSVAIGLLLGVIAVVVGTEMRSLLIGEAATSRDVAATREALTGTEGVRRLIHLRTMHLGPDELLVAGKIELDPAFTFAQVSETINRAEARIRAAIEVGTLIYLEPDIYREPAGKAAASDGPVDRAAPGAPGTPTP
jgi:cation diffusion facilitator family transporter